MIEKQRSSDLVKGLQQIQNEFERSEGETKRRLERRVEALEHEVNLTRENLKESGNENKLLTSRKEIEIRELREKYDRTVKLVFYLFTGALNLV